jgi:hypothetical protein
VRWRFAHFSDGLATAGIFLELFKFITLLARKVKKKITSYLGLGRGECIKQASDLNTARYSKKRGRETKRI